MLVVAVALMTRTKREATPVVASSAPQTVFAEARVLEVAQKFRCGCGNCGGTPLEECSCPSANTEKQFIADRLNAGQSADEVIRLVNQAYGWLKTEYQSQYGGE